MLRDAFHHPLTQPAPAMRFQYEHISEIRHRGKVADDPGKADLRTATIINAKAQGMLDGSCNNFLRDVLGPIAVREESVNHFEIEDRTIGADHEFAAAVHDDGFGS